MLQSVSWSFQSFLIEGFFLSILIIIYKDNNKDDTMGSKLIVIYPVAITQRGASERYVPSQGRVREKGKGVKLGNRGLCTTIMQYCFTVCYLLKKG